MTDTREVKITTQVRFKIHGADTTRFCDFCRQSDRKVVQSMNHKNTDICTECIRKLYRIVLKDEKTKS